MVPSIICAHESNRREAKKNNYRKVFFGVALFLLCFQLMYSTYLVCRGICRRRRRKKVKTGKKVYNFADTGSPIKKVSDKTSNKPLANIVGLWTLASKVTAANHFFGCALPSEASGDENFFGGAWLSSDCLRSGGAVDGLVRYTTRARITANKQR